VRCTVVAHGSPILGRISSGNQPRRLNITLKCSAARPPEQTDIGRFWLFTGPATYNPIARQVAEAKKLDLVDCARMFALIAMAGSDAHIAVFDAKYTYNLWRPITAVRNADQI